MPEGDLKHSQETSIAEKPLSTGWLTKLTKATETTNKEEQENEKVGIKFEGECIPQWCLTPVRRLYFKLSD